MLSSVHDPGCSPVFVVHFYLLVLGQILAAWLSIYGRFHLRALQLNISGDCGTEVEESRMESCERNLELENFQRVSWTANISLLGVKCFRN